MSKRRILIRGLLLGISLVLLYLYCNRNSAALSVELASLSPASPLVKENTIVIDLWLARHHSQRIDLTGNYVLQAEGISLPVRISAISYPVLQPHQARLSVELVTAEDAEILLMQRRFKLSALP